MRTSAPSVLVFRIGSLGDTIVSLPALWAVREHFAGSRIELLYNYHPKKKYILAAAVLAGSSLVDGFLEYPADESLPGRALRPVRMLSLLATLRRRRFDTLVYLVPSERSPKQIARDKLFFGSAGIRNLIGTEGFPVFPGQTPGEALAAIPHEADLLLARLAASGIPVPSPGRGRMDLGLGESDRRELDAWLSTVPPDGGRPWVGVGPGAKQPANVWPPERYQEVVRRLIQELDVWPVVFGGPEDRPTGEGLVAAWRRGYNSAGRLAIRPTVAALERCLLHLGNDTGTLHLAAAAKTPCVGVYSSRNPPGYWEPYGVESDILRTRIECEGCRLSACVERGMECILRIQVQEVVDACMKRLELHRPVAGAREVDSLTHPRAPRIFRI